MREKEKAAAMPNSGKLTKAALDGLIIRVEECGDLDRSLDADLDVALFGGETQWRQQNYTMTVTPSTRRPSKMHVGGFSNEPVPFYTGSIDEAVRAVNRLLPEHDTEVHRDRDSGLIMVGITKRLDEFASTGFVSHHESESIATMLSLLRVLRANAEMDERFAPADRAALSAQGSDGIAAARKEVEHG